MNRSTAPTPSRTRYLMALSLGFLLGQAVALMPQRGESAWISFSLSAVFIASSAASFVLFTLSQQRPLPRPLRSQYAHGLVGLIGVGLLLALRGKEFFA